jgi:DNA-binding NarL/FixJ family response regulator
MIMMARKVKNPNPFRLTKRELEVLELISKGYRSREIADHFGLSLRTVEAHRHNILGKTGASNSVTLLLKAMEHMKLQPV